MNALDLQEEAKTHMTILTELLRDVNLEARMMTLIKAEEFISEKEMNEIQLQSIRIDLELELTKLKMMLCMVERAQYAC